MLVIIVIFRFYLILFCFVGFEKNENKSGKNAKNDAKMLEMKIRAMKD